MTKYKLKKANNQIYILDVDAEIMPNDLVYSNVSNKVVNYTDPRHFSEGTALKVIATSEQIDIDNLWEKYLEALVEKENIKYYTDLIEEQSAYNYEFKNGYLQAKKETCFSEQDLRSIYFSGLGMNNFEKTLYELKLSKIPECSVEIEMESVLERSEYGMPNSNLMYCFPQGIFVSKPKLTDNKVTITKIIL